MSDQSSRGKSKYEAPIIVPLGEMAKGSGVCAAGSSVVGGVPWGAIGTCTVGPAVLPGITDCAGGAAHTRDCTAGITAFRDCTAGTAALRDCTGGVAATDVTCAAGGAV